MCIGYKRNSRENVTGPEDRNFYLLQKEKSLLIRSRSGGL